MKGLAFAATVVVLWASNAQAADVIKGCYQKNNGQFRVLVGQSTCRPSEVAVSLRSATDTDRLNPEVFDANGQFLGVGQAGDLYLPSLRKWTSINLTDASGDLWHAQLYYESGDCTGQPYAGYEYLHRVFSNGQPLEQTYWTAAPELEPGLIVGSLRDGSGNCQVLDFPYAPALSKATAVTLPFTAPVALPTTVAGPAPGLAAGVRE